MTMSVEKVREYLTPYGVADRMREFEVSSATVELAALAVGVEGARIAKTLSFKVGEDPILIVAAGDAKVDNSKYKHFFGAKAKMLTAEEAGGGSVSATPWAACAPSLCPTTLRRTWMCPSSALTRCSPLWAARPAPLS